MDKTEAKGAGRRSSILDETENSVTKILEIENEAKKKRTVGERISDGVAAFAGSMTFVYLHVIWFGGWILFNTLVPKAIDPFPFTFLTFVVSLEAIFLSTFILISQNHDTRVSERRNHLDLQINLLAEKENTKMLELLKAIAEKVGVDCKDDAMEALLEDVDAQELAAQINRADKE